MNKKTVLILVIAAVLILLLTIGILLSPDAKGNQLPPSQPSAAATPPVSSSPETEPTPEAIPGEEPASPPVESKVPESPVPSESPDPGEAPEAAETPAPGEEPTESPAPTPSAPVATPAPTQSPGIEETPDTEFPFPDINEEETPGRDEMDSAEKQARIDELIARVYALRDYYTGQLASIEAGGIAEYRALPEEEKTESRKKNIALSCADRAYALEGECDGQMDDICRELGLLIIDVGGDMDLVSEVRYAYASEKASVKNSYFSLYSEYLG